MPRVPEAQIVPSASSGLYPRRSISGSARMPIAVTAAPTTPVMAAIITQMITVPIAKPPRSRPNHSSMAL